MRYNVFLGQELSIAFENDLCDVILMTFLNGLNSKNHNFKQFFKHFKPEEKDHSDFGSLLALFGR